MSPLANELRARIVQHGPISFRDFMQAALYHPAHGYYSSGRAAIGRRGDFLTNVSVGALFGRLLARRFVEIWRQLGEPDKWTIVEQGAHRGQFARDALEAVREFSPRAFAAVNYVIVEPSEIFRAAQKTMLADFPAKWFSRIEEMDSVIGVHFSNELLDAFPVHLVARTDAPWVERHVAIDGDRFVFVDGPLTDSRLAAHLAKFDVPAGFVTEINLAALDWIEALASKIKRGSVLAVDYGYTREQFFERPAGTLSAYAAHQREPDPLARPGEIDLTAHVDFTSLIEHATRLGFRLQTFTDQQRFMVELGRLHFANDPQQPGEVRAFKTLMHPGLLGQAFKVICLEKC